MTKLKRKTIHVSRTLDEYSLEGKLDDVIEYLTQLRKETNGTACVDITTREYYGDTEVEIELHWTRPETDEDYDLRVQRSNRAKIAAGRASKKKKIQKEKDEREMLAKLKAKYDSV